MLADVSKGVIYLLINHYSNSEEIKKNLRSQETPGVTGKFGFGVQNEAGQKLIEFCKETTLVMANTLFQNTREDSIHGYHQMANTEISLVIFLAAKDKTRS